MPPGGIRTQNPSRRAAVDPRLRPRGHWDRRYLYLNIVKMEKFGVNIDDITHVINRHTIHMSRNSSLLKFTYKTHTMNLMKVRPQV
jgi:hypothetical protein